MEHEGYAFVSQIVATLIGVAAGGGVAFWVNKIIQDGSIEKTRNETKQAIVNELTSNQIGLFEYQTKPIEWHDSSKKFTGNWGLASDSFFKSATGSGNLLLIPSNLQNPINEIYHHFELFNSFIKQVIEFSTYKYPPASMDNEAKELLRRITEQVDYLIPRISKTVVDLKPTKK